MEWLKGSRMGFAGFEIGMMEEGKGKEKGNSLQNQRHTINILYSP